MKVKYLLVPILVAAVFMCFSCDGSGSSRSDGEEILRILNGAADASSSGVPRQAGSRVALPPYQDPSGGFSSTGTYEATETALTYTINIVFTGYEEDGVVINGTTTVTGNIDVAAETVTVNMTSSLTGTFNSKPFVFTCNVTSTGSTSGSLTMTGQYTFNGETESVSMSL